MSFTVTNAVKRITGISLIFFQSIRCCTESPSGSWRSRITRSALSQCCFTSAIVSACKQS
ncbi:Uncharacterised protein [Vibrio cholerae]|nr:Uncharacterised protein [Vibrio cholerae]